MMKRTIFASITLLSCLALATAFTACKEEPKDTTKPIIELIEPEDHDKLLIGDEHGVHFEMKLSDDDLVKSYKIDIHNNFDGHSHTRDLRHGDDNTKPFTFNKEYSVNQRNASIHHHDIKIPADATPGEYHLLVYCVDRSGNESMVARTIILSKDAPGDHHHDHDHDHDHGHDHDHDHDHE